MEIELNKTDWNYLKILIDDLKTIFSDKDVNERAKAEIIKLIYEIETEFFNIKDKFNLNRLNTSIISKSVINSFNYKKPKALSSSDYQYYLLGYLLLKNNEIRKKHLTLFKIIDDFIKRIANESFTWQDIEITGSGATRCKTNLRFAFNGLKSLGLVNLYDREHKKSWSLTFLGFFLAANFCLFCKKDDSYILNKKINNEYISSSIVNAKVFSGLQEFLHEKNFKKIIMTLKFESLGLKNLEKGEEIFNKYNEYIKNEYSLSNNDRIRKESLTDFLDELNKKYSLEEYMSEISLKFKAEEFFMNYFEESDE